MMNEQHIRDELKKVSLAVFESANSDDTRSDRFGRLYAAQQVLTWALDSESVRPPFNWATGGTVAPCHGSLSQETSAT